MEIGEYDEFGFWRDGAADFSWVESEVVSGEARETLYRGLAILGGGDEQFVSWVLDEDFIAGFDAGGHGQVIRH